MKRLMLLYTTAATMLCAQDNPLLPSLAERGWFKAQPLFTSPAAAPALPSERSWLAGPAFTIDSPTAPAVTGRAWQLSQRLRFSVETATYVSPRYRMVSGLPSRDTAAAVRFEFRF